VLFLFPFAWVITTSFKTNDQALTNPTAFLSTPPQWGNYPYVISILNFWRETLNSLIMAVSVTLGQVLLASLAGYAFAQLKFFGRDVLFLLDLATLIIPLEVLFVSLYLTSLRGGSGTKKATSVAAYRTTRKSMFCPMAVCRLIHSNFG
jgi:multiple sugar transport system permease protein